MDVGVNSEEDRPMNEMEQATETLVFEQQDDQTKPTANPASRVGEDWDIDYWTLLMEARIVG